MRRPTLSPRTIVEVGAVKRDDARASGMLPEVEVGDLDLDHDREGGEAVVMTAVGYERFVDRICRDRNLNGLLALGALEFDVDDVLRAHSAFYLPLT